MASLQRRARERELTQERIIEAARAMFAERGYEAVTMRAIAERIEYTPTAIYHHFRDKDALIAEICSRDFLTLAQQFVRFAKIEDPVERMEKAGRAYVRFGLENPNHYRTMFMTALPHPSPEAMRIERRNPDQDAYGFILHTATEAIQLKRFRPEFQDPDELAQMLWAAVHGITSLAIAKGSDDWVEWREPLKTADKMIDALLRGLRAEPA